MTHDKNKNQIILGVDLAAAQRGFSARAALRDRGAAAAATVDSETKAPEKLSLADLDNRDRRMAYKGLLLDIVA